MWRFKTILLHFVRSGSFAHRDRFGEFSSKCSMRGHESCLAAALDILEPAQTQGRDWLAVASNVSIAAAFSMVRGMQVATREI